MRILTLAIAGLITGTAAQANGDALVIGNSVYNGVQTLFSATQVDETSQAMRDQGFDVTEARDATGPAMSQGFADFVSGLDEDGPVLVMLAGAFLHGPAGAYLLPASDGAALSDSAVMVEAFPIDAALSVLAKYPGRGFLVLSESAVAADFGDFLSAGPGALSVPSGVTVLRGPESAVSRFAAGQMTTQGQPVVAAAVQRVWWSKATRPMILWSCQRRRLLRRKNQRMRRSRLRRSRQRLRTRRRKPQRRR